LSIPSTIKPGKEYRLRFTDSKNGEDFIYSPVFKVVPKIPTVAKILVPALIAGGVAAVVLGGGSSPENPGESSDELPIPPVPLP
jgi:hypothetical protein